MIQDRAGLPQVEVSGVVEMKNEDVVLHPTEQFELFDGQPYVRASDITVED